ncbi:MAG: hypothetical protein IPN19_12135 [Elusimicrobia bacterium]|nr:hypothetical protein [Elusimicrobiota bacterium]
MKTKVVCLAVVLFLSVAHATEWSTNLPCFYGGSYDGWDRNAMGAVAPVGGMDVTMSSGLDQQLAWLGGNPGLGMVTITAASPAGTLTSGTTIQVRVPTAWPSYFDSGAAVTVGGSAGGKVGAARYSMTGQALEIPVTTNFADGDTLTVSGLKLAGVPPVPNTQRLELNFTGTLDAYDQYALTASSLPSHNGGSYDGWDRNGPADYHYVGDMTAPDSAATFSAREGAAGFEVTVVNPSGGSAGDVTFSPVGELTMALAGATNGVRAVEKWMGSRWSLVGSARVGPPGVVTVNVARTGIYRVMGAAAGGSLVREVYNRSFSPNGDGRAESVVFRLENPENLPMEGAIYSSENMHIADMAPGPIPGLTLTWDGRARHGAMCEGGIYTYEINVGGRRTNGIVVLLK